MSECTDVDEIHPAAAVWPMLNADELESLAESIRTVGLINPIVVWPHPETGAAVLLDGRNRLEACKIAGVEPEVEWYTGDDPELYVLAANEHRRHSTPSQRAMAVARTVKLQRGRPKEGDKEPEKALYHLAERAQVSPALIKACRFVLQHAPQLADAVMAGTIKATAAQDEARRLVLEQQRHHDELERIRAHAPDLLERLNENPEDNEPRTEFKARISGALAATKRIQEAVQGIRHYANVLRETKLSELGLAAEYMKQQNGEVVDPNQLLTDLTEAKKYLAAANINKE